MRVLVTIASYGTNNDVHLVKLLSEYARMPYHVDVVVVSNIPKDLGPRVEVVVGLPIRNPWSLPFAHKRIFADRLDSYDLFVYSEDDTLLTTSHVEAFLDATSVLQPDEIAGFLRSEEGPDGSIYYSSVHHHFHWDGRSVCRRGSDVFAYFTNEHGACYILTQNQLRHAIASGGFLVPPHEGRYDMLVSAATDPYTQCGFRKLVCISRIEAFTCKHLTNKYVGRTGLEKSQLELQIQALLAMLDGHTKKREALCNQPRLPGTRWIKSYYEPRREDLIALIPGDARHVLSIGCGWGETEAGIMERGIDVVAVPLDGVIAKVAEARGVEIYQDELFAPVADRYISSFDAILVSGIIHLVERPLELLSICALLLREGGTVIVDCPNPDHFIVRLRRLARDPEVAGIGRFELTGVHSTSERQVRQWLKISGLEVTSLSRQVRERWRNWDARTGQHLQKYLANEFAMVGTKRRPSTVVAQAAA